jgi:hypothetical protein
LIDRITPLVITFNEAMNIGRPGKLNWGRRIVVIDSGSTDETHHVAQCLQAEIIHRRFDTFAE